MEEGLLLCMEEGDMCVRILELGSKSVGDLGQGWGLLGGIMEFRIQRESERNLIT